MNRKFCAKAAVVSTAVIVIAAGVTQIRAQTGAKVLLIYDMEGVTEVTGSRGVSFGSSTYDAARNSLTEDVNAAIRGLLRGGAREVVLTDGHGSGNPDPDYDTERMPDGARHEIRDDPYDPYVDVFDESFDAVVAIGMHGGAGSEGFLSHTYYGHTMWVLNGQEMNESMVLAASAERYGIPLILVTGDDVLKQEMEAFSPQTQYVVVKQALGRTRALAMPREEVTREIEAAAQRAIENIGSIPTWSPFSADTPVENHFSYTLPEHGTLAIEFPGTRAVNDRTVALTTSTFLDSYLAFRALANFTALVQFQITIDALREVEGWMVVLQQARNNLRDRPSPSFEPAGTSIDLSRSARGRHGYK